MIENSGSGYLAIECVGEWLDEQSLDTLCDALTELGALSVDAADADAGTDQETPLFGEPGSDSLDDGSMWPRLRLQVLFPADAPCDRDAVYACIRESVAGIDAFVERTIADADWVRETQAQFAPIPVADDLLIIPSWIDSPLPANMRAIRLDPGVAFGTGSHPTTQLCLEWLNRAPLAGAIVVDYGTGSGILAILAAMRGAARVIGIDIDPQAVAAAQYNAKVNGVAVEFIDAHTPLDAHTDFLVANILTNPLKALAPLFAARVRAGGVLVLSGILAVQAGEVVTAYAPDFALAVDAERDGWVRMVGQRASA
jgi:ribosomal protein L11 methyltransferase